MKNLILAILTTQHLSILIVSNWCCTGFFWSCWFRDILYCLLSCGL